jgi:TIR domain
MTTLECHKENLISCKFIYQLMYKELKIKVMKLQAMLQSRATGRFDYDENEFEEIREEIIRQKELRRYIPDFLFSCRTLDQFWDYIQPKFAHYAERRSFLQSEFNPLLSYLEEKYLFEDSEVQEQSYEYDIALSFAGENRDIVDEIAKILRINGVSVFYDNFEKHKLWGKRLSQYFQETYGESTHFVVPFISKEYSVKDWTDFEFTIARNEANNRKTEFILPVRIDDTKIVGLSHDVAYLDYNIEGIEGIVENILLKLNLNKNNI